MLHKDEQRDNDSSYGDESPGARDAGGHRMYTNKGIAAATTIEPSRDEYRQEDYDREPQDQRGSDCLGADGQKNSRPVATPFPPWNSSQMGNIWPMTARMAAIIIHRIFASVQRAASQTAA